MTSSGFKARVDSLRALSKSSEFNTISEVPVGCPMGYNLLDGICYLSVNTPKTFYEAESACNAIPGGHLAAFHSQQDYDNLIKLTG